jgi:hypothetical protein
MCCERLYRGDRDGRLNFLRLGDFVGRTPVWLSARSSSDFVGRTYHWLSAIVPVRLYFFRLGDFVGLHHRTSD